MNADDQRKICVHLRKFASKKGFYFFGGSENAPAVFI
jgi:hypothetical protein